MRYLSNYRGASSSRFHPANRVKRRHTALPRSAFAEGAEILLSPEVRNVLRGNNINENNATESHSCPGGGYPGEQPQRSGPKAHVHAQGDFHALSVGRGCHQNDQANSRLQRGLIMQEGNRQCNRESLSRFSASSVRKSPGKGVT
jgi:hypothetical protein